MANIAVINAVELSRYALAPLDGGASAFERAVSFARALPEVASVHVLVESEETAARVGSVIESHPTVSIEPHPGSRGVGGLFEVLQTLSEGADDLFYFYGDCPLLDPAVARRMHEHHRGYFAEYTFADGYPLGMTPEIVRVETLPRIAALVRDDDGPVERGTLFSTIQRDINAFDIETEISPRDLRLLRVRLSCDTRRNFILTSRIVERGGEDEESILALVADEQQLLRTLPAFFELQVTERMAQVPSYSPFARMGKVADRSGREMTVDDFRRLVDAIEEFAEDAVVNLSFAGEPALHSNIDQLIGLVLAHERLQVLIETSGVGWDTALLERLSELPQERMIWIVDLDASTEALYERLRGPGWQEAQATCTRLIELFPGRVHVQAVRMEENEEDLESFYRSWKERVSNVIIQKYDWYCGSLPQRKVADLSPLRRLPCWHIKRDMVILVDGRVPMCREDLEGKKPIGNAFEEALAEIWERGQPLYLRHVAEDYPEMCARCDEYYTYNF